MLKKSASVVLGSSKSSTYPLGYVEDFDEPAALLDGLFEHPPETFSLIRLFQPDRLIFSLGSVYRGVTVPD